MPLSSLSYLLRRLFSSRQGHDPRGIENLRRGGEASSLQQTAMSLNYCKRFMAEPADGAAYTTDLRGPGQKHESTSKAIASHNHRPRRSARPTRYAAPRRANALCANTLRVTCSSAMNLEVFPLACSLKCNLVVETRQSTRTFRAYGKLVEYLRPKVAGSVPTSQMAGRPVWWWPLQESIASEVLMWSFLMQQLCELICSSSLTHGN